jgi:tetratricopeptide (TPR) repeat protein
MSVSESSSNSTPPPRFTTSHRVFVGIVVVGVVFAVWLLFPFPVRDPGRPALPDPPKILTKAERGTLLNSQHQAIGHLENEQWFDALQVLKEIDAKLPEETFAPRNMAVAMCGKESYGGNEPRPIQPEEAEAAAQRLLQAAPNDFVSSLLAARIAANCQQKELALERFRKATLLAPSNPVPWFELYKNYEVGFSKTTPEEAAAAIKKCYQLAPDNLVAATEYVLLLAREHDPKLQEELKAISSVLAPLRKLVPNPNQDPVKYVEEALALLPAAIQSKDPKDWNPVINATQRIKNVSMGSDMFKSSLSKLRPHPLDFIQFQYESEGTPGQSRSGVASAAH